MKITSWNVNSVRARIINIINYLNKSKPDIVFFQEIKTIDENFPHNDFKKLGYDSYIFGQKSYNGVAIISKLPLSKIDTKFIKDINKQSRIITGDLKFKSKIIKLINIYAPNGNPIGTEKYKYKIDWYDSFIKKIKKTLITNSNILIGGDFNIIPEENDVYDYEKYENDALFKLEIRKKFRELLNLGFNDIYRYFNKNKNEYTFWDYMGGSWQKNNGLRIDHFLASNDLNTSIKNVNIDTKPRSKNKPSDHTPIEIEIN